MIELNGGDGLYLDWAFALFLNSFYKHPAMKGIGFVICVCIQVVRNFFEEIVEWFD